MKIRDNKMKIFHVHTERCKHASEENEEQYVQKAIQMNASDIYFTDHVPFPGNPFGHRMDMEQLEEYLSSLQKLKHAYKKEVNVHIGLEIEYLPSFHSYYEELHRISEIEIFMMGQHFFEVGPGKYSYHYRFAPLDFAKGVYSAMEEGLSTGWFSYVAHPDRMFRYCPEWNMEMQNIAQDLISIVQKREIVLEQNLAAIEKNMYWPEFWECVPEGVEIIRGVDAHSTEEMERIISAL